MPPDQSPPSPFADLWSMLHEGGLLIETRVTDDDTSPVGLRTLLQLDGDRIVWICRDAVAPLSHYKRLRVAVRHRRMVRRRSMRLLNDASHWVRWARLTLLPLAAAHEAGRFATDRPIAQLDWQTLLWHHAPGPMLLLAGLLAPMALRFAVPRLIRWRARATIRERAAAQRQASKDYVAARRAAAPP